MVYAIRNKESGEYLTWCYKHKNWVGPPSRIAVTVTMEMTWSRDISNAKLYAGKGPLKTIFSNAVKYEDSTLAYKLEIVHIDLVETVRESCFDALSKYSKSKIVEFLDPRDIVRNKKG